MSDEEAVREAVRSCIDDDVLKDVLQEDENRAISSLLTALTQEEIDALHEHELRDARKAAIEEGLAEGREEGLAEGREEGLAEGREEGVKMTIIKLVSEHVITPEEGAKQLDVTVEEIMSMMEQNVADIK